MIDEEERSVDELVDEICEQTKDQHQCRKCGKWFHTDMPHSFVCPDCKAKAYQKGKARADARKADRGTKTAPVETCLLKKPGEPVPGPADDGILPEKEAVKILADGIRYDRSDCILGMYEAMTEMARASNLSVTELLERLTKIDEALR